MYHVGQTLRVYTFIIFIQDHFSLYELSISLAIDPTAHNGNSWTSSCCDSHRSILLSPMLTLSVAMNLWPVRRLIRHFGTSNLRFFFPFNPEQSGYSRWIWHHLFCFTCFRLKRTVRRWFTWAGSTPNGFLAASCFHLSFDTMPFINLGFFIFCVSSLIRCIGVSIRFICQHSMCFFHIIKS